MFGFFGIFEGAFGRSREQQRLDHALRATGVHPRLVPDAVKLTILKLLKETRGIETDYEHAAEMLAFCMLGAQGFKEANGPGLTKETEARMDAALEAGDSLDARLILLALAAGLIRAEVVERYQLEAG